MKDPQSLNKHARARSSHRPDSSDSESIRPERRFLGEVLECQPGPAEYIQLAQACDFLEHYHLEHTQDKITRFRGKIKRGPACDIIIVSDPEWKAKLRQFLASEFPDENSPAKVGSDSSPTNSPARSTTKQETPNEHKPPSHHPNSL